MGLQRNRKTIHRKLEKSKCLLGHKEQWDIEELAQVDIA